MIERLIRSLVGLASALVPEDMRQKLVRSWGVDPPSWSFLLGLAQFFVGGLLLLGDGLSYFADEGAGHQLALVDGTTPREMANPERKLVMMWSGAFTWVTWIADPMTWFLAHIPLTGLVRLTAFGVTREAVAEPLVFLGWIVFRQLVAKPTAAAGRAARYGPLRPDRLLAEDGSDLVVLSCRPQAGWNELVTIEHDGLFYRLLSEEERRIDGWWWHCYRLRESDPTEVIRSLVRYEPRAEEAPRDRAR